MRTKWPGAAAASPTIDTVKGSSRQYMSDLHSSIRVNSWLFGVVIGAVISAAITLVIVVWEWRENPGGIYRDANGTNLGIVFDTAISWLVPVFIGTAIIASVLQLLWSTMRERRSKH